jgi:DNA-directed RNA polymerase subunit beta'
VCSSDLQELFEARTPKGEAPIAELAGRLSIDDSEASRKLVISPADGEGPVEYPVTKRTRLLVQDGEEVTVGQQLVAGAVDPKNVLRVLGPRATQKHLVDEVQEVYRSQGVEIHDKHIEVIVRQMLRRVTVLDSGDTQLLPGELVERGRFEAANHEVVNAGGKPASARPELMGITKASLATESWLSAASFQETTRVLTEAALAGRSDVLFGLKENVIIGKLIPAGTGLPVYRNVAIEPTEEAKANLFPTFGYEEWDGQYFGGAGQAVRLEEFDIPRND